MSQVSYFCHRAFGYCVLFNFFFKFKGEQCILQLQIVAHNFNNYFEICGMSLTLSVSTLTYLDLYKKIQHRRKHSLKIWNIRILLDQYISCENRVFWKEVCTSSVMVNLTCMSKVIQHDILGDMSAFNTWQQLISKACPVLVWVLVAAENGMCSRIASGICTRTGCAFTVFGGCRGRGRAFSEAASRGKALCNSEQPWVGHRGLQTERELCLKVSGTW